MDRTNTRRNMHMKNNLKMFWDTFYTSYKVILHEALCYRSNRVIVLSPTYLSPCSVVFNKYSVMFSLHVRKKEFLSFGWTRLLCSILNFPLFFGLTYSLDSIIFSLNFTPFHWCCQRNSDQNAGQLNELQIFFIEYGSFVEMIDWYFVLFELNCWRWIHYVCCDPKRVRLLS